VSSEFQYDVFLSHSQADKPRVRRLAERLRAAGRKPKAECGVQKAEFLHSAFFLRPFLAVGLERSTVLFRDPSNAGRRFIPLLLADCKLPDTLRRTMQPAESPSAAISALMRPRNALCRRSSRWMPFSSAN
jgi:hypothetical protein